jgi:hypothetical protein
VVQGRGPSSNPSTTHTHTHKNLNKNKVDSQMQFKLHLCCLGHHKNTFSQARLSTKELQISKYVNIDKSFNVFLSHF